MRSTKKQLGHKRTFHAVRYYNGKDVWLNIFNNSTDCIIDRNNTITYHNLVHYDIGTVEAYNKNHAYDLICRLLWKSNKVEIK